MLLWLLHAYMVVAMATRPWLPWLPGHGYNTGYHGYQAIVTILVTMATMVSGSMMASKGCHVHHYLGLLG